MLGLPVQLRTIVPFANATTPSQLYFENISGLCSLGSSSRTKSMSHLSCSQSLTSKRICKRALSYLYLFIRKYVDMIAGCLWCMSAIASCAMFIFSNKPSIIWHLTSNCWCSCDFCVCCMSSFSLYAHSKFCVKASHPARRCELQS